MSFPLRWVSSVNRWKLTGPAGPGIDMLVSALVDTGMHVEVIEPTVAYRVDGDAKRLLVIAEQINEQEGYSLAPEPVPDQVWLKNVVDPARPYRRTAYVHGGGNAFRFVARAVDLNLQVSSAGTCRWAIKGSTAALLAWAAAYVHCVPVDEVLKLWQLTADAARAEDEDATLAPVTQVLMRGTVAVSTVKRNDDGEIVEVVQITKGIEE